MTLSAYSGSRLARYASTSGHVSLIGGIVDVLMMGVKIRWLICSRLLVLHVRCVVMNEARFISLLMPLSKDYIFRLRSSFFTDLKGTYQA